MTDRIKSITVTMVFILMLIIILLVNLFKKDIEISVTERRILAMFPKFSISKLIDGSFIDQFENYTMDQFINRDNFRSLKTFIELNIFGKQDVKGVYEYNGMIIKQEYPLNEKSVLNATEKINKIKLQYLNDSNKIYYTIVPDKNYYVEDKLFLKIDYDLLYSKIEKLNTTPIDIRDIMNINDYYKTDTHWIQENLDKVVKRLSEKMNFTYTKLSYNYNTYSKFYGVYYGQAALNGNPDTITYLTNDIINECTVEYLENPNLNTVYNPSKLTGMDSYDVFLDGASSFITINNPNSKDNRELVVFRDSFGSSLIPLLIPYYSKITVIDIRYITSDYYLKKIEFTNQDVLFLYSTLLINDSSSLKN